MEIIQTTALISINETLWVQLVSFLLFLFVINRVMFRRVRRNIDERAQFVDEIARDIDQINRQMDALRQRMRTEEAKTRDEALRMRESLREDGQQESRRILESAQIEVARMHREAEQRTNDALAGARQQLATESTKLAATIMEHLLKRRPVP